MIAEISYSIQHHIKKFYKNSNVRQTETFMVQNIFYITSLVLEINYMMSLILKIYMQKYKYLWNVSLLFHVTESNVFHLVSEQVIIKALCLMSRHQE